MDGCRRPVAGLRRACPSAALDKVFLIVKFYMVSGKMSTFFPHFFHNIPGNDVEKSHSGAYRSDTARPARVRAVPAASMRVKGSRRTVTDRATVITGIR